METTQSEQTSPELQQIIDRIKLAQNQGASFDFRIESVADEIFPPEVIQGLSKEEKEKLAMAIKESLPLLDRRTYKKANRVRTM